MDTQGIPGSVIAQRLEHGLRRVEIEASPTTSWTQNAGSTQERILSEHNTTPTGECENTSSRVWEMAAYIAVGPGDGVTLLIDVKNENPTNQV